MARLKWKTFMPYFQNWVRKNNFVSADVERTLKVMQASMTRSAPNSFQPAFEKLFGKIEPQYLTPDIISKCNDIRKGYTKSLKTNKVLNLDHRIAQQAIDLTNEKFGLQGKKFNPVSPETAASRLPGDTSSAAPNYITPKRDELPKVIYFINKILRGEIILPTVKDFWPVTLVWRTQMRQSGLKHRIIAAFPQVCTVIEMMFGYEIFALYDQKIGQTVYSFGSNWEENAKVWEQFQEYRNSFEIDYDTFDQTVSGSLIFLFYTNIEHLLNMDYIQTILFRWIRDYHLYACVITSEDGNPVVVTDKKNGILSGSVFTNFADSWINHFIIMYCTIKSGRSPENIETRIMGDDVVAATNYDGTEFLNSIKSIVENTFEMSVSEKSVVRQRGEPFYYMGFLMNNNFKYMSEDLMKRKMTTTSRFIPETDLPNRLVVWSKFCSICAACSNGYAFWLKYKQELLNILGMDEPTYFHDIGEGPGKSFSLTRIVDNAEEYVRTAWRTI